MRKRSFIPLALLVTALLLLTELLFAVPPAKAQTETLRGQLERETARSMYPLRNMRVTLKTSQGRRSYSFYTDDEGYFYFRDVPPGDYTLEIWVRERDEPVERHITVPDNTDFHDLGTFEVE